MRISWACLVVACFAACGSTREGGAVRPPRDRDLITAEELAKAGSADAYSVVQALHPQWLVPRGASSINLRETIKVYLDGNLLGGVESLRQIAAGSVGSIRRLDGLDATQRYGLDHGQGALLVITLRGRSAN